MNENDNDKLKKFMIDNQPQVPQARPGEKERVFRAIQQEAEAPKTFWRAPSRWVPAMAAAAMLFIMLWVGVYPKQTLENGALEQLFTDSSFVTEESDDSDSFGDDWFELAEAIE